MNSSNTYSQIKLHLNISDQLTSISCGHVVVELIKFIAYQRLQIPYTYQWLKQVINKKKEGEQKKDSFQSERHFRIASTALENLDFILKSLQKEIGGASLPEEICIALGATPVTCKEIYRFLLPTTCHQPQCQSINTISDQGLQRRVFKTLVTSDKLSEIFFDALPPTNLYVFMKKKVSRTQEVVCGDSFVFISGCRIPRSAKVVTLDFNNLSKENITCCNDFQVFGDSIDNDLYNLNIGETSKETDNFNEIESDESASWFQSSYVMKGFKDCVVNGNSVTNTWLD